MPTMNLNTFVRRLALIAANQPNYERRGLRQAGIMLAAEARSYIGDYQPQAGPFPAWQPLADRTIEDRTAKGYTPDDPLLRTGAMRRSIGYTVNGRTLSVGSNEPIAFWQEMGTRTIPPRSFLGRALAVKGREATNMVVNAALRPLLTGGTP